MQFLAIAIVLIISVIAILVLPARTAKSQEPKAAAASDKKEMAMCYDIAIVREISEYVCPKCGEKTNYQKPEPVVDNIVACRREVEAMKSLTKLGLTLDESACCGKCSPDSHKPALSLVITFDDKTKPSVGPITLDDLKRLHEFLAGKLSSAELAKQAKPFTKIADRLAKAKHETKVIDKATIQSMSREQLETMLRKIETTEVPKAKMGAMCYSIGDAPSHAEYVCPVCGEKTIYGQPSEDEKTSEDKPTNDKKESLNEQQPRKTGPEAWKYLYVLSNDLPVCRDRVKKIRATGKLDVKLDETALCAKCSKASAKPQLALVITYQDGTQHRVAPVSDDDLRILYDFIQGKLLFETFYDGTEPLKDHMPRLRQLLGLEKSSKQEGKKSETKETKKPTEEPQP